MIRFRTFDFAIRTTTAGRLDAWIGSALRGIVAQRMKELECRHPAEQRVSRWRYCDGCPHAVHCAYGRTYESQRPQRSPAPRGAHQPPKPIVLSPYFPLPSMVPAGQPIPLRAVLLGAAAADADALLRAIASAGRQPGIGPDRVAFELAASPWLEVATQELTHSDFPVHPAASPGVFPRVGIGLRTPLFLSARDGAGRRRPVLLPTLADLFLASWRIIVNAFWFFDDSFDADPECLLEAAKHSPLIDHCYQRYDKPRYSSRRDEHFTEIGVEGGGVYANVPAALLPWLVWGGRMHVGRERVAGAGGWRVILD